MRIKKRCCALLFALMMTILYANAATLCVGAENNELEISAPSYYKVVNEAETPIKRPEAGMIQTKVSATNHKSSSPARATLIVAVYDDIAKTLKSLDTDTQEIAPNGSVVLSAQTLLPTLDGYTYKYFVWDDFATMSPLQTAPESPMALSATATVHTAMLSWEAADDRTETYNIYRNGSKIGTTQNLHYVDYNLDFGTDYTYAVTACSAARIESAKTELTVQTEAPLYSDLLNTNNGITYTKIGDTTNDAYGETKELNGTAYRRHGYFYRNGTQKISGGAWFKLDSNYYTQKATTVYALELTYYIESPTNTTHNIKVQYGAKPGVTQVISIGAADLNCWKTSYLTLPNFDGQNFYGDAIITAEGIVKDIPWISYVKMKDGGLSAVFSKDFQHRNDTISFSELTRYEVLIHSLDHDSVSYKQLINELYTNGFKKEQIHERTSTNQILVEASMNKAIGIMPEVFFDGRIQQMKVLHISDSSNDYGAVLAYRKDDAISYIYKLVDCIKKLNLTIK